MNAINIFSALVFLAVVTGPVAAQTAKPVTHDHQMTKGSGLSSVPKGDKASEDCTPTGAEVSTENAEDAATDSKDSKVKCEPEKSTTQRHDHREMKNLQ